MLDDMMLSCCHGPIQRRQRHHCVAFLLLGLVIVLTTGFAVPSSSSPLLHSDGAAKELDAIKEHRVVGMDSNYVVTGVVQIPPQGLCTDSPAWRNRPKPHLSPTNINVTLPTCLMVLEPDTYPTQSKALKTIRNKLILVQRNQSTPAFLGKADTRVFPGDLIVKQKRKRQAGYSGLTYAKPRVSISVVYEDHHMAIVNKPSGVITYSLSKGGFDKNSVLRALPHILMPPPLTLKDDALEWPVPVHRLDYATCGLLVISKTHGASKHLSEQFSSRKVVKTYTAILNGVPMPSSSSDTAYNKVLDNNDWNVVDSAIDGKPAITLWREVRRGRCMHASNMTVTLVEFRPLHGRKHQLRRHAAEVLKCPIVGDELYDDGSTSAVNLRQKRNKIFLCSNAVTLGLPYGEHQEPSVTFPNAHINKGRLEARINLPKHFEGFLSRQEKKMRNYEKWMIEEGLPCLLDIYALSKVLLE